MWKTEKAGSERNVWYSVYTYRVVVHRGGQVGRGHGGGELEKKYIVLKILLLVRNIFLN